MAGKTEILNGVSERIKHLRKKEKGGLSGMCTKSTCTKKDIHHCAYINMVIFCECNAIVLSCMNSPAEAF